MQTNRLAEDKWTGVNFQEQRQKAVGPVQGGQKQGKYIMDHGELNLLLQFCWSIAVYQ